MGQNVPKRWHIKSGRQGMTQKKAYNIPNMAKFEIKNASEFCWPSLIQPSELWRILPRVMAGMLKIILG
jgi:hypothetical protein